MKKLKFEELVWEWLSLRRLSVKHSTYVKYENVIEIHIIPYFKNMKIKELSNQDFIGFFEKMMMKRLSNSYLKSMKSILSSILNYGVENYHFKSMNLNLIKIPSCHQSKKVLSTIDRDKIVQYTHKNVDSLSVAMLLALYGGLRLGEIAALKWACIDFTNQVLFVEATVARLKCEVASDKKTQLFISPPKTPTSRRVVPLPLFLFQYLHKYSKKKQDECYVLSKSKLIYEPRKVEKKFKWFCLKNNIQCNFHNLRHSFATDCVRNNVDIKTLSEILGHANVSITLNFYVHTSLDQKKKEINKIQIPKRFMD